MKNKTENTSVEVFLTQINSPVHVVLAQTHLQACQNGVEFLGDRSKATFSIRYSACAYYSGWKTLLWNAIKVHIIACLIPFAFVGNASNGRDNHGGSCAENFVRF